MKNELEILGVKCRMTYYKNGLSAKKKNTRITVSENNNDIYIQFRLANEKPKTPKSNHFDKMCMTQTTSRISIESAKILMVLLANHLNQSDL